MSLQKLLPGIQRSTGCSEPGAIALAAAVAARAVGGVVQHVRLVCDSNTIKNATGAGIPGTSGGSGATLAAALGALCGDPSRSLQALAAMTPQDLSAAQELIAAGGVEIMQSASAGRARIRIEARVVTSTGQGCALIEDEHTRVVQARANGVDLPRPKELPNESERPWQAGSLSDVLQLASNLTSDDYTALVADAAVNMRACAGALSSAPPNLVGADPSIEAEQFATAASRDRMEGGLAPIVTSGFSGNQGLVATVPVSVLARRLGADEGTLARALATSHLVGEFVRRHTGVLSPVCNAVHAASMGAAAACVRLLGGDANAVGRACDLVAASVAGTLCDGAKPGCSLKVGLGASRAIRCAEMAVAGVTLTVRDGLIGESPEETIQNLGKLAHPILESVDREVTQIVLNKPSV